MPLALITDDDEYTRLLYKDALERVEFTAMLATNVSEAIRILESNTPELVCVDMNMPGHSGLELVRFIRSTPRLAATKVIVVTGNTRSESHLAEFGVDLFLVKPVSIKEMTTLAKRLIS